MSAIWRHGPGGRERVPGVIRRYPTTAAQTADRRGRVLLVAWRLDRHPVGPLTGDEPARR
jgi:hypothetical protein